VSIGEARVLVVGIAYKIGVSDIRESPGFSVFRDLRSLGATVDYHDPFVAEVAMESGTVQRSVAEVDPAQYDLVIVTLAGQDLDLSWIGESSRVLDCTYRLSRVRTCELV